MDIFKKISKCTKNNRSIYVDDILLPLIDSICNDNLIKVFKISKQIYNSYLPDKNSITFDIIIRNGNDYAKIIFSINSADLNNYFNSDDIEVIYIKGELIISNNIAYKLFGSMILTIDLDSLISCVENEIKTSIIDLL